MNINRRGFLKRAGGLAAGFPFIVCSSALGKTSTAPSNRVATASLGVGGQGGGLMNAFLHIDECQVVAVCDPFKDRREKRARQVDNNYSGKADKSESCKYYHDFRDVISRDDIDACVIATPDHWHVPMAIAAAKAGKDVYVEKPLGLTMEQNKQMRQTVHEYGTVFQYGTQQRGSKHCAFACELVRNGRVGKIKEIHVVAPGGASGGKTTVTDPPEGFYYDLWLGPAPAAPYVRDRCVGRGRWFMYDYAIGFLGGWGAHPLDLMHWGYPEIPVEYEGTGRIPTEGLFDTITNWSIKGKYSNGCEFTFKDGPDSTTFVGDEGWVKVSRGSIDAHPKSLLSSVIKPGEIHLHQNSNHYKNFIDCVKSRKHPHSDIDSAVQSDFVSHLSDIAVRTGRKLTWDPKAEMIVGDKAAARLMKRAMRVAY